MLLLAARAAGTGKLKGCNWQTVLLRCRQSYRDGLQPATQKAAAGQPFCYDGNDGVRDGLQPGGARSCIGFASEPWRRHGMVATYVRLVATIQGEAATSWGHPMAVVTTTRRGDHVRTAVLQLRHT